MSKENLEQFMSKVADSVKQHGERYFGIDAEALVALGAECGCEFTAEELQESAELSDEELDEVAGGLEQQSQVRVTNDKAGTGAEYGLRSVVGENGVLGFYIGTIDGKFLPKTRRNN